jgi:hypothetical protein
MVTNGAWPFTARGGKYEYEVFAVAVASAVASTAVIFTALTAVKI